MKMSGRPEFEMTLPEHSAGSRTGRAQPDRTGLERLVLREKSFCEPIPPVTQFIHLVRPDRVHIRDGYQLHSRRGMGIKPGQLAAGSCQCQRKRLRAVAEEIASANDVAGIEAVIDLTMKLLNLLNDGEITEVFGPTGQPLF